MAAPAERAEALLESVLNERGVGGGGDIDMDISTESGEVEAPPGLVLPPLPTPPPMPTLRSATTVPPPVLAAAEDDDDELAALRAAVLESTMRAPSPSSLKRKLSPPPPPPPQPVWGEPAFDTVRDAIVGVSSAPRLETKPSTAPSVVYRLSDYESPLAYFRAYRLSPHFRLMTGCKVSDLSYSHRVDPQTTLCRFDVDGVCNDSGCAYQHWREMTVSAVQLVRQLVAYTAYSEDQFADVMASAHRQQQHGDDLDAVARRTVARIHELNAMVEEGEEKAEEGDTGGGDGIVWRARKQRARA
jgi:hypothetical protein